MQETLFLYKKRFLAFALIVAYAYLHVKLTGIYVEITLDKVIDFDVRLPFAQRILVPGMGRLLMALFPLNVEEVFFILEVFWDGLLFLSLYYLTKEYFPKNTAKLLTWIFFLLLPLMSVINYRYTAGKEATFYYSYDTASIVFIFAGFLLCLREQWKWFVPLIFVATCNRETSILLLFLIPIIHWDHLKKVAAPLLWSTVMYVVARGLIAWLTYNKTGGIAEIYYKGTDITHFSVNLIWLLSEANFIFLIFSFCGLTLFWFVFFDYIPQRFRALRYLCFFYFLSVLVVGNLMEARVLEEIVALLYFPVCIAVSRWLSGETIVEAPKTWRFYIDRYFIFVGLIVVVLGGGGINNIIKAVIP